MLIPPGSTDRSIDIYIEDAITGLGKTGILAANITCYFSRMETDNDCTVTQLTLSDLSALTDAHSDGGWIAKSATNMPGNYRLDLSDAVCATGAWTAVVHFNDAGTNNLKVQPTLIELKEDTSTSAALADAVLDEAVDGTTTLRQSSRLWNSALGGKASGLGGTNALYRDLADSMDRIDATVDSDGNRTAVTLDLT